MTLATIQACVIFWGCVVVLNIWLAHKNAVQSILWSVLTVAAFVYWNSKS